MFRKITKYLTNNLGIKIASVLIATVLWLVVMNFDDPKQTKAFSVPITVVSQDILEEREQVYNIVNDSEMATFSVTGNRSYIDKLSASNFTAKADLTQVDFSQDTEIKLVPIEIEVDKWKDYLVISKKTVNMQITIEDLSTEQFVISPTTMGEPADGYAIGEKSVEPNLLKISGPQSVVSKISTVAANINVEGISSDVTDRVKPVLYDEFGHVLDSDQLQVSQEVVKIQVKILGTKSVPVRCDSTGTPLEGYFLQGIEFAPEEVVVKGEPSLLSEIKEISISNAVDIAGATTSVENTIEITGDYLPEGISLLNPEEGLIAVKAVIEKMGTKVLDFPVNKIQVDNLGEDYQLKYSKEKIKITVRGFAEDLEKLKVGGVKVSINAGGLGEGNYTIPLEIKVNEEKYEIEGEYEVRIRIEPEGTEDATIAPENNGESQVDGTVGMRLGFWEGD